MKAVIFDMDGVIFDTERLWRDGFRVANEKFGITLGEDYRMSICGKTEPVIREELKKLFPNADIDGYRDCNAEYIRLAAERGDFSVKSGFSHIVGVLKEKGYKTGLATSSKKSRAQMLFSLKGMDIDKIFDAAVYGEDAGTRSKPDPYIFLLAAEKLGEKPSDCFIAEDSLNGIRAAVNGGFRAIMVKDLIPPDDFCKENCTAITSDLFGIEALL